MDTLQKQEYKKPEISELSSFVTRGQNTAMGDPKMGETMEEGNSTMGIS
jgi:hypothetical protein